jgi:Spy/CpxP family protein refolding chaperone
MVSGKRAKAYAVLGGVFVLGVLAGGGSVFALSQREVRAFARGERQAFEHRRLDALERELDLTREQRAQIAAIFDKYRDQQREARRAMMERCGEPMREQRRKLLEEMDAVLTPEQRKRHAELMREHEGRPFGPPGGPH